MFSPLRYENDLFIRGREIQNNTETLCVKEDIFEKKKVNKKFPKFRQNFKNKQLTLLRKKYKI